jgi:choline dehydrogenase-like flavoprotein
LSLHPGVAVAGLFDERIDGYQGIPQSYECTELLDHTPGSDRRIWITTAFAHPIGAAAMLPGFGEEHRRWMKQYAHLAVLTAMLHDDPVGQVGVRKDGLPRVSYRLDRRACEHLGRGIRACAELLLAAGARRVLVPHVPPLELASPSDLGRLSSDLVRPHALPITSVHPLGTLPLGDDPRRAVVRSDGEHHQIRRLFVLDGSLFPTGLGVPPQLGIYAMARHLSPFVADRAAH